MYWKLILNVPDFFYLVPIWPTLGPYLTFLINVINTFEIIKIIFVNCGIKEKMYLWYFQFVSNRMLIVRRADCSSNFNCSPDLLLVPLKTYLNWDFSHRAIYLSFLFILNLNMKTLFIFYYGLNIEYSTFIKILGYFPKIEIKS